MLDLGTDLNTFPRVEFVPTIEHTGFLQDVVKFLTTPTGALFWDRLGTVDLRSYLNTKFTAQIQYEMEQRAISILEADERVTDAQVEITQTDLDSFNMEIKVQAPTDETFLLVGTLNQVAVNLDVTTSEKTFSIPFYLDGEV